MNIVRFERLRKWVRVLILFCLITSIFGPVHTAAATTTGEEAIPLAEINAPPQILEGDQISVTMSRNGDPHSFQLSLHATDADPDSLTWQIDAPAQNGTASVSGLDITAEVSYMPKIDYIGTDRFTVEVSDEHGGTDSIVVDMTITPVPDAQEQQANSADSAIQGNITPTPIEPEIVGGGPADPGEYPWQVALVDGTSNNLYGTQFCGGSLVAPQWVLTAAHCITGFGGGVVPVGSLDAVAGIYDLTALSGYQRRDVIQIIRHPSYADATLNNDLALLKLKSPVPIGGSGESKTAVIPLVPANIGDLTGVNAWVTGWGETESIPSHPNLLYEVQVPILANSVCNDFLHYNGQITPNMLCAGYDAGGFDSCQGDSGGPLVVLSSGQWKLAGIVSWGDGCAEQNKPGVYTRVSQYVSWIQANINTVNSDVYIGGELQGSYEIPPHGSIRQSYPGVNDGPVEITGRNGLLLMGAERVIYKVNGLNTSFTEMMGLPASQLDTTYWLPWYNNVDLDTQLRIANISGSQATVTVTIGGVPRPSFNLAAGASTRVSYPVNNGPVKIASTQTIVAAERVIYKVNGIPTSFSEMMALPQKQVDTVYYLPWYNHVEFDTQLRIANVSNQPATVTVTIGTQTMPSFNLAAGASTRVSYPVNNGPVKIASTQTIVAAERVIYRVNGVPTSFTEMMALPSNKLGGTHWLPWYNNTGLSSQLRISNVGNAIATVRVYIGGQEMLGSPFNLAPGTGVSKSYAGIDSGPVKIVSTQNIVVSEPLIYKVNGTNVSFAEMMGLPNPLLATTYWFPWYNNVDLDTQLRFGVP